MNLVTEKFRHILDDDENILWADSPTFIPFLATGVPFLVIGIIWGFIDYFGFIQGMNTTNANTMISMIGFFTLHLFPCWGSILNMFRLAFVFGNTGYAITNKRAIIRTGFFGIDYKSIDYDKINETMVNVNPLEHLYNVGSVKIFSGQFTQKGRQVYDTFIGIKSPYDAYKMLKKVSVDVKTDWNYPNQLRPENNHGYKTSYKNPFN